MPGPHSGIFQNERAEELDRVAATGHLAYPVVLSGGVGYDDELAVGVPSLA